MKLTSLLPKTTNLSQRVAEFSSITQALDYAASGETGVCFYDQRGDLTATLTYRDLRERAISTGAKLRSSGLNRGDAVAIIGETAAEFLYLFYGCQYAGLVACPPLPYAIYPGGKTSYVNKLAAFIRGGNAKLVCLPDALKELSTDLLQMTGVQTVHYRQLDAVQGDIPPEPLGLDEPAYIQFSSGSTAEPKGIRISQEAVCHNVKGILRECIEITSDDRAFSWLPFYHDMGLVAFRSRRYFLKRPWTILRPQHLPDAQYYGCNSCRKIGPQSPTPRYSATSLLQNVSSRRTAISTSLLFGFQVSEEI